MIKSGGFKPNLVLHIVPPKKNFRNAFFFRCLFLSPKTDHFGLTIVFVAVVFLKIRIMSKCSTVIQHFGKLYCREYQKQRNYKISFKKISFKV